MKIIFIETERFEKYPPSISVLNALSEINGIELHVIALEPSNYLKELCQINRIKLHNIGGKQLSGPDKKIFILRKIFLFFKNRKLLWNLIGKIYTNEDLLWIHSLITLKQLGKKILSTRYIFHVYELLKEARINYRLPYPKIDLNTYYNRAYKVIECEYNRAQIIKAWFDLKKTPAVIPNKLYLRQKSNTSLINIENNIISSNIRKLMNSIKNKKIILFQGGLGPERPINKFIEAVGQLGNEYAMLVMTSSKYEYDITPNNLYLCQFIPAPYHLAITKMAYIGILCYKASKKGYGIYDTLNSIYCAPNKLYEYSEFGLPMIGNDIPGLTYTIEQYNMGVCVDETDTDSIKQGIITIEKNYNLMKENSKKFYNDVDIKMIIQNEILKNKGDNKQL